MEEVNEMNETIEKLQHYVKRLRSQLHETEEKLKEVICDRKSGVIVSSSPPTPDELLPTAFLKYVDEVQEQYPQIKTIFQQYFSSHSRRKERSGSTDERWLISHALYKSFLADSFLKSKDKYVNLRTHYFIGLALWHANVSEPVWRLLQKFRVVPSREVITQWVKSQPLPQLPSNTVKVFSFDNCDMKRHVTHV